MLNHIKSKFQCFNTPINWASQATCLAPQISPSHRCRKYLGNLETMGKNVMKPLGLSHSFPSLSEKCHETILETRLPVFFGGSVGSVIPTKHPLARRQVTRSISGTLWVCLAEAFLAASVVALECAQNLEQVFTGKSIDKNLKPCCEVKKNVENPNELISTFAVDERRWKIIGFTRSSTKGVGFLDGKYGEFVFVSG